MKQLVHKPDTQRTGNTHHLDVRGNPGEKVQQLVVVDQVRVTQLLGELIHAWREYEKKLR